MAHPQVSDDHALHFLATNGYLPLALSDHPGMVEAYTSLFARTTQFFALPSTSSEKTTHAAASGAAASEEGFSQIPSEKQIITVKTASHCPATLLPALDTAWSLTGTLLQKITTAIASTLSLPPSVFDPFITPCLTLPTNTRTPTLVRMFRYDRPPRGSVPKVNAERHKDLGLLSLVVGHSPGLQAPDTETGRWVDVEDEGSLPRGAVRRSKGLRGTLLVGETLAWLSRGRYRAGVHRVVCAPPSEVSAASGGEEGAERRDDGVDDDNEDDAKYRYSIVYTLRAAPAPLFTREFESQVVGQFEEGERVEGESSAVMFEKIMRTHWNVNVKPSVRDEQRRRFEGKNGVGGQGGAEGRERASG